MKKNIVFVLLLMATAGFAQHFELGVKAGPNISYFRGSAADIKTNTYIGFHAGAFVSLFLGNNFAIQPEALLVTGGSKLEQSGTKSNYKLTYVTVPVMLKYRFNGGFFLEAGPQLNIKVNEKVDGTSEDFAKNTGLAVCGGIGYHSSIGLGVGVRYVADVSKLGDVKIGQSTPDWKNSAVEISVFYTLFNNHRK